MQASIRDPLRNYIQQVRDREGRYMANTIYLPTFRIRTCVPFPQYWM